MEPMTTEERLTRIANLLQTLTESQVQQQETLARHDAEIEKQNAGIRDLVLVSRTLLDSQKEVTAQIEKLREAQETTDEKLHALIDTVDRIIRQQNL
jgi:hypothetical protein